MARMVAHSPSFLLSELSRLVPEKVFETRYSHMRVHKEHINFNLLALPVQKYKYGGGVLKHKAWGLGMLTC